MNHQSDAFNLIWNAWTSLKHNRTFCFLNLRSEIVHACKWKYDKQGVFFLKLHPLFLVCQFVSLDSRPNGIKEDQSKLWSISWNILNEINFFRYCTGLKRTSDSICNFFYPEISFQICLLRTEICWRIKVNISP